ncbi:DUF4222 domain-containing protein [Escherichia coli]|uniref:DUF4222 domain-containing protein n=1 Tax=Escherichia coli TaxID=562 RepID=UPI000E1CE909|nr:DUF4222 domain-containing protein [Escherichia coli]
MFDVSELPSSQQHYIDDHGTRITVISVEDKRGVFMRDGYPYPCMRPMYNFLGRFQKIQARQDETAVDR